MSNSYADRVECLRGHLEEIQIALNTAYGYHIADDLTRQYKNVGGVFQASNLTKRIEKALAHVEGYLAVEIEDENE